MMLEQMGINIFETIIIILSIIKIMIMLIIMLVFTIKYFICLIQITLFHIYL